MERRRASYNAYLPPAGRAGVPAPHKGCRMSQFESRPDHEGADSPERPTERRRFLQMMAGLTAGLVAGCAEDGGSGSAATPGEASNGPTAADADAAQAADAPPATAEDRLGPLLPQRPLGRTGERVTMMCIGGGHLGGVDESLVEPLVEAAYEQGVRFVDTAESYGRGHSERRIGRYITPGYRDVTYLMTKTRAADRAAAAEHLDGSRRRMNVDVIDLWQMHDIRDEADVDRRLEGGVLDVMLEAQQQGKVRHLGFTGHTTTAAHRHMLRRLDERGVQLQTCQMPVNVVDPSYESFIVHVLPELVARGYGVLAMKTLAYGQLLGRSTSWKRDRRYNPPRIVGDQVTLDEALGFVWSLPITSLVSGVQTPDQVRENTAIARQFPRIDESRRQQIIARVAHAAGPMMEFYKARV